MQIQVLVRDKDGNKQERTATVIEKWLGSAAGDGRRGYGRVVEVEGERLRIDDSGRVRDGLPIAY